MAQNQPNARHDLRDDLRYLGKPDAQAPFLFKHKIDTLEQQTAYRDGAEVATNLAGKGEERPPSVRAYIRRQQAVRHGDC